MIKFIGRIFLIILAGGIIHYIGGPAWASFIGGLLYGYAVIPEKAA